MRNLFLVLFTSLLLISCAEKEKTKVIYIVRHAEKAFVKDPDPELAPEGLERAQKLASILEKENIQHVFSTDYKRTQLTGLPTAAAAGITIQSYDPRNQSILVEKLKELDGNILVIGHSNTVSQLANEFIEEGEQFQDLQDNEYDFIYEVHLNPAGAMVLRKVYKDY